MIVTLGRFSRTRSRVPSCPPAPVTRMDVVLPDMSLQTWPETSNVFGARTIFALHALWNKMFGTMLD